MKILKLKTSPYDANVYLIDRKILIDVGMDAELLICELENHIKLHELETIILTHGHYDHTGCADEVAKKCNAKIAIHKNDAQLLGDANKSASTFYHKKPPTFIPDILLNGGEVFSGYEVIHTPGHTPGGICLYNSDLKILFSGDTVFQEGSFGRTDLYGGNSLKIIESIKKLTQLDVNIMYPGHGDIVFENANEQIKLSLFMASQYS